MLMDKTGLRKLYLSKQKELTPVARAGHSYHISQLFFRSLDLAEVNYLHCFLPIERYNEINTHIIIERLWKEFPRIETVVPRVNLDTNEIENLKFTHETELVLSNWQIHEPSHDEL